MARSRLPLLRRISQIFFLLAFFALLIFTSLRPTAGATGDIHMRAPVRLFFEWDPLVAVANAWRRTRCIAGCCGACVILVPTLFSGAILLRLDLPHGHAAAFCGQHALGGEARQATH